MARKDAIKWLEDRGLTYQLDLENKVIIIMDTQGKFLDALPLNKVDVANWVVANQ